MKLKVLLRIIGVVQLILGLMYLFIPMRLLAMMGHSAPQADIAYPLGMLASRFLAYGVGMLFIAREPDQKQLFWINNMILIQIIDLVVGIFYTATGIVGLNLSIFPMFNATLFIILLTLWRPKVTM